MAKRILLIATGGTIACVAHESGLCPAQSGDALLAALPPLAHTLEVVQLGQWDSTDLTPARAAHMAQYIWRQRDAFDGFVLTHGTDTMAYCAALLYYLLPHFDRPVILTGSMRPLGVPQSDAPGNLSDALCAAEQVPHGIYVCMHGTLFHPLHVTKRHTHAAAAFVSHETLPAGWIAQGTVGWYAPPSPLTAIPQLGALRSVQPVVVAITPWLTDEVLRSLAHCSHLILLCFGTGGLPEHLVDGVQHLLAQGVRLYAATQCAQGTVDLTLYAVGQRAQALGIRSLHSRTVEDALAAIACGALD